MGRRQPDQAAFPCFADCPAVSSRPSSVGLFLGLLFFLLFFLKLQCCVDYNKL